MASSHTAASCNKKNEKSKSLSHVTVPFPSGAVLPLLGCARLLFTIRARDHCPHPSTWRPLRRCFYTPSLFHRPLLSLRPYWASSLVPKSNRSSPLQVHDLPYIDRIQYKAKSLQSFHMMSSESYGHWLRSDWLAATRVSLTLPALPYT